MNLWSDAPPMTRQELKTTMEQAGLTPAALARLLGRRRETIWRWLRGRTVIPAVSARRIRELQTPTQPSQTAGDSK